MWGKWETYPREFAKCRRCRKAKYFGKECQSTAWSEGHRFWCSAEDIDDESSSYHDSNNDHHDTTENATATLRSTSIQVSDDGSGPASIPITTGSGSRTDQRQHRKRQHHHHHSMSGGAHPSSSSLYISPTTTAGVRAEANPSRDRTVQSFMQPQPLGWGTRRVLLAFPFD